MNKDLIIIENMKKLGFSEYEVKAYLKLLEEYPVNGYTLSKNSGIPRSKIYEVLESLKSKQIVFEQLEGKTTLFHPLEPRLLMDKLKYSFENIFNEVDEYTNRLYKKEQDNNELIAIKGREKILEFLRLLIMDAKKRIALSIWEEEAEALADVLEGAALRGVILKGIYFGKHNKFTQLITHRRIERYLSERKERYMTVAIDGIHVVGGILSREEESQVTWTRDKGFVEMSEDYIAHDVMVNVYSNGLEGAEKESFERLLDNVRKDYFGFTDDEMENFK